MAPSSFSVGITNAVVRRNYWWPEATLTFWIIFMIVDGVFLIREFASLAVDQSRLHLGTPWSVPPPRKHLGIRKLILGRIMTYSITVGVLTEVFVWAMLFLSFQRNLLPGIVMILGFILLVLYVTGFIGTAVQLFGPVLKACRVYVDQNPSEGMGWDTVVWLKQQDTCQSWYVGIGFWGSGMLMLVWVLVLARNVLSRCD